MFESVAHLFVLRARSKRIFLSANNRLVLYLLLLPLFANRLNPLKSSICINTFVREFRRKLKCNLSINDLMKQRSISLKLNQYILKSKMLDNYAKIYTWLDNLFKNIIYRENQYVSTNMILQISLEK